MPVDSLKTLRLVRSYSVPIRDDMVSKLITWYVNAIRRAINMIWDNIGGRDIASQRSLEGVES
jgi:hypothetical protein